jgi:hypothetical protein
MSGSRWGEIRSTTSVSPLFVCRRIWAIVARFCRGGWLATEGAPEWLAATQPACAGFNDPPSPLMLGQSWEVRLRGRGDGASARPCRRGFNRQPCGSGGATFTASGHVSLPDFLGNFGHNTASIPPHYWTKRGGNSILRAALTLLSFSALRYGQRRPQRWSRQKR